MTTRTTAHTTRVRAAANTYQCSACKKRTAIMTRDVCVECSRAYVDGLRRRRAAVVRLPRLDHGHADPIMRGVAS